MSTDNVHIQRLTHYRESGWKLVIPEDCGVIVVNNIHKQQSFEVRGVTSKGIFIETDQNHVIFLSKEKFRGPLTINCRRNFGSLEFIEMGDKGCIDDSLSLLFIRTHNIIAAASGKIYKLSGLPLTKFAPGDQFNWLLSLISEMNTIVSVRESPLLQVMINIFPTIDQKISIPDELAINICKLINGIREFDNERIADSVHYFCGRGLGLTPSGDDFLLGLLYVLNSLRSIPETSPDNLTPLVLEICRERTTWLSYQLIRAACLGQVDERLHNMAMVLTGNSSVHMSKAISDVATWGNSSGMDATSGMLAALSLYR